MLEAPTLTVDLRRRTVDELEAELLVDAQRQRALVEIRFRDDDAIVPLLRRHARDEDLRLHAVRVLGAKGPGSLSTTFTRIMERAGVARDIELPGRDEQDPDRR